MPSIIDRDSITKKITECVLTIHQLYSASDERYLITWFKNVHALRILIDDGKQKLEQDGTINKDNHLFSEMLAMEDKWLDIIVKDDLPEKTRVLMTLLQGNNNTLLAEIASLKSKIEWPSVIIPLVGYQGLMDSLASRSQRSEFNLQIIKQYVADINRLRAANVIGKEFDELCSNADMLIIQAEELLNKKDEFDNLPFDIQLVASYVKHPDNDDYLKYIVKNIPVINISVILKELSLQTNVGNQRIYNNYELLAAQKNIYAAIKDSDRLKWQHAGRILLTGILFFIATPFSLILTIPWVRNNKHNSLLETRTINREEYQSLKLFRSGLIEGDKNEKSELFNKQAELKAKKVVANNIIEIDMLYEQAERFDRWLKLKSASEPTNMSDKTKLFFQKSKDNSKEAITSCQKQYANRMG